jgi:hypothetical protein
MRIKFKAQRVDNDEWVYGLIFNYSHRNKIATYIQNGEYAVKNGSRYGWEVHPETICQFTGLFDKNNEEIYYRDKLQYGGIKKGIVLNVNFSEGAFGFMWNDCFCSFSENQKQIANEGIEVIGNILDKK